MKNFEFTGKTTLVDGIVLHQIRATKDLPMHNVERGDVGGWIEKPENLSENAWVADNAQVYGDAQVSGNAKVSGNAWVFGNAWISGDAWVCGDRTITSGKYK